MRLGAALEASGVRWAILRGEIDRAAAGYAAALRARRFPGPAEIYFAKAG